MTIVVNLLFFRIKVYRLVYFHFSHMLINLDFTLSIPCGPLRVTIPSGSIFFSFNSHTYLYSCVTKTRWLVKTILDEQTCFFFKNCLDLFQNSPKWLHLSSWFQKGVYSRDCKSFKAVYVPCMVCPVCMGCFFLLYSALWLTMRCIHYVCFPFAPNHPLMMVPINVWGNSDLLKKERKFS